MVNKNCGIYKIQNKINQKMYIGLSCDIRKRWHDHKRNLINNSHYNKLLQRSWNKYGKSNFEFMIIELCEPELLNHREVFYIKKYKSNNIKYGFNMNIGGGSNIGFKHSLETRKKISEIQIGKIRSAESCRKASESLKGRMPKNINMLLRANIRKSKTIMCFDKDGNFVNEYNSIHECSRNLSVLATNIVKCLKGTFKTCGNFVFIYSSQYDELNFTKNNIKDRFNRIKTPKKGVFVYNIDGEFLKSYNTIKECSVELSIDRHAITNCCMERIKSYKGFIFKYIYT